MGLLFPILLLAMGVYVLVGAIKGSGRLFTMENFKDDSRDKAKKYMRILYFALAAIMLLMAVANGLQSTLYGNKLIYCKVTDAYREAFPDLTDDNGQLYKTERDNNVGKFSLDDNGDRILMTDENGSTEAYNIDNEKMSSTVCVGGFIQGAYNIHPDVFPVTSGGLMNCMGGSVDYQKYIESTELIDDVGNPIYATSDSEKANGHVVYLSAIGNARSDTNDGSFFSKLYNAISPKLLSILNYVFLGLAAVGLVGLFLVTRKYTDKEKVQKAREQQVHGPSMPSSAFEFDEDEKKPVQSKK